MTKKYWGIWIKSSKHWADSSYYKNYYPDKIIRRIPIWLNKNHLEQVINFDLPEDELYVFKISYEIREFTPADALLAKCGKI